MSTVGHSQSESGLDRVGDLGNILQVEQMGCIECREWEKEKHLVTSDFMVELTGVFTVAPLAWMGKMG